MSHARRAEGKSSYSFAKLWKLALNNIIAHSDKPLRLSMGFGFLMALFSFLYGSYLFANAFFNKSSVAGWSSLMVSLYFIGGIIITNLLSRHH